MQGVDCRSGADLSTEAGKSAQPALRAEGITWKEPLS